MKKNKEQTPEEKLTEQILVSQSNALTTARYNFSLIEKRIVYKIIEAVRRNHIEVEGEKTIFDNLVLYMSFSDLKEVAEHKKRVTESIKDLRLKHIEMEDAEGNWLLTGFMNYAKFDSKTQLFQFEVSRELLPHLVELSKCFTTLELTTIMGLKSTYSQRLFEFCSMWRTKGYFFYEIDSLRKMFLIEEKYVSISLLREKVLDIAQLEIKGLYDKKELDFYFEYSFDEKTKIGKKYTRIHFKIFNREEKEVKIQTLDDLKKLSRDYLTNFLFFKDKNYVNLIIQYAQTNPSSIADLISKITRIVKDADKVPSEQAKLIRHILKSDFGIAKAK